MKRSYGGSDYSVSKQQKRDLKGEMPDCTHFIKLVVNRGLAAAVIGKGGQRIEELQRNSGAVVRLSQKDFSFPVVPGQVLVCGATDPDKLGQVLYMIVQEAEGMRAENEAKGKGKGSEDGVQIHMVVPRSVAGKIIGKGGANISSLREQHGAKVSVNSECVYLDDRIAEQVVMVGGNVDNVQTVASILCGYVQEEAHESWFIEWGRTWFVVPEHDVGKGMGKAGKGAVVSSKGGKGKGKGKGKGFVDDFPADYGGSPGWAGDNWGQGSPMGGAINLGGGGGSSDPVLNSLMNEMANTPSVASREMQIEIALPNSDVGAVMGRGGLVLKDIQMSSGAKFAFSALEEGVDERRLTISGPAASVYLGHYIAMQKVVENHERMNGGPAYGGGGGGPLNQNDLKKLVNNPAAMNQILSMMGPR